ncbi:hypothetical protein V8E54_002696, partial [Elaphomyces granulatus]
DPNALLVVKIKKWVLSPFSFTIHGLLNKIKIIYHHTFFFFVFCTLKTLKCIYCSNDTSFPSPYRQSSRV